ncbi:DEAD/DEAH box helicase [Crossiella cryophila]|uniref:DEAD/DEAH box helicase domain-containing protein n=1 Tax=Crossiella cryophila TaxID=43355 RepID=A0A7W7FQS3_9PSEU|nr:DEAD/DEAH box helicase [Crossiella cryophila]MBB4675261.1 DEAD/DEAH box helicase domain-containing protein [Crossiella cryophila]
MGARAERTERTGRRPGRGGGLLDRVVAGIPLESSPLTHVAELPERVAAHTDWPAWAAPPLIEKLTDSGVPRPWAHQAEAAGLAWSGAHVVIATGTASGKSLAYQLPVLSRLLEDPKATALYLSPTKALGADQLRAVKELDLPGVRPAAFDGDTPLVERDWVRAHARWIFTNPDMIHRGILPGHQRWGAFFRRLSYVVIDECHSYRGLFGSHVALLLRRLRRIAARYGANPTFVLASATVADPAASATRLTGLPCTGVTEDASPAGPRTIALWEPPLLDSLAGENGAPVRRSAGAESARIMADLVLAGARTLAFVRSRRGAELTAMAARRHLADVDPDSAARVAAYRGGYLPEERRALETALSTGDLLAVATTNALELGVDITGLDAVLIAGYPGTLASFWQQAGRAGRDGQGALVVFVANDDPLDTYLVHHPEAMLSRPVEATVLDPANPYVLAPQLACAAAEQPLTEDCLPAFGGEAARQVIDQLVAEGHLRRRPAGWYWSDVRPPHGGVDIRGSGGDKISVVEADSGRLLGTVDPDSACAVVHPGALYLHQGQSYVVDELDLDNHLALVHAETPDWSTMASTTVEISVLRTLAERRFPAAASKPGTTEPATAQPSAAQPDAATSTTAPGAGGAASGAASVTAAAGVTVCLGEVEVTAQVVGYLRRRPSGEVIDRVPLDLPAQSLPTRAVWYTISAELLRSSAPGGAGLDPARIPGALHAAEHAAIGLLPLFATCDRWDIGGVSTALHADTGEATVFVHDGHPGGAGFADRGYAAVVPWLAATREAIAACECPAGCPSCVQSPKCGNGNEPLDKAGAVAVLDAVLGVLPHDVPAPATPISGIVPS